MPTAPVTAFDLAISAHVPVGLLPAPMNGESSLLASLYDALARVLAIIVVAPLFDASAILENVAFMICPLARRICVLRISDRLKPMIQSDPGITERRHACLAVQLKTMLDRVMTRTGSPDDHRPK